MTEHRHSRLELLVIQAATFELLLTVTLQIPAAMLCELFAEPEAPRDPAPPEEAHA